jgi:hypothetical protein
MPFGLKGFLLHVSSYALDTQGSAVRNRKTRVANKGWRPNSDSFGNGENRIVKGVLPRAHENSRSYLKVFLKIQIAVSEPSRSSYS